MRPGSFQAFGEKNTPLIGDFIPSKSQKHNQHHIHQNKQLKVQEDQYYQKLDNFYKSTELSKYFEQQGQNQNGPKDHKDYNPTINRPISAAGRPSSSRMVIPTSKRRTQSPTDYKLIQKIMTAKKSEYRQRDPSPSNGYSHQNQGGRSSSREKKLLNNKRKPSPAARKKSSISLTNNKPHTTRSRSRERSDSVSRRRSQNNTFPIRNDNDDVNNRLLYERELSFTGAAKGTSEYFEKLTTAVLIATQNLSDLSTKLQNVANNINDSVLVQSQLLSFQRENSQIHSQSGTPLLTASASSVRRINNNNNKLLTPTSSTIH